MTSLAATTAATIAAPSHTQTYSADVLTNYTDPQREATCHNRKAIAWQVTALVTAVALSALTIGALYATSALTPLAPAFILSIIFGPVAISGLYSKIMEWSMLNREQTTIFESIAAKLATITSYTHAQMSDLLRTYQIDPARIPIQDFSAQPFKILVAHFLHHKEKADQALQSMTNLVPLASPSATAATTESDADLLQRYRSHHFTNENVLLPSNIRAAQIMQRMYAPAHPVDLATIGRITPKTFEMRQVELLANRRRDYFVFNDGTGVATIDLLTIQEAHQRIFLRV